MDLGLTDKVALVTGTASQMGMGKEIALTLTREGCHIIASDINQEGSEKTAAEIRQLGRKAVAIRADICNAADVKKMVAEGMQYMGKIDILVNVAGGATFGGPLVEMSEANIDKELAINLRGAMNCTRAVLPGMLTQKYGKIVNISSFSARTGVAGAVVYSSAKEGLLGLTKSLAKEVGQAGINVNAIAPGLVMTEFYGPGFQQLPPQMRQNTGASPMSPTGKMTTTKDIANMVAFLVSDLSGNVTGQTISVDGGQFMI
jgi:NAD(P)-dependent dehydrogenase (short-subunit alcohol dehydrogenase family)